jgi:two-component system cell cycle response regulator CpdR
MARILLAEDDDNVRAFVERALKAAGYTVVATEDGGLAAETLEAEDGRFDLLLSDIRMPVMDGIGLALSAKSRWPELTILLMTGFAEQRERTHGLAALIYDVIAKPFSLADLLAKVEDALSGKPVEIVSLAKREAAA